MSKMDHAGVGLLVTDVDRQAIGTVIDVRAADFVIHRPLQPDVYVAYDAVQSITSAGVVLIITATEVDDRHSAQSDDDPAVRST